MKFAEIGARIKALRLAKGLKQEDVAAALHTSRVNYTKMETGERDLKTEHCVALAEYFGVTCDFILRGVEAEHLDIHKALGLSEEVIQALREGNELRKENLKKDPCNMDIVSAVNGLLSPAAGLQEVLIDMYCFFYTDFVTPYEVPVAAAKRNRQIEMYAYLLLDDPALEQKMWTLHNLDNRIYKHAYWEKIKGEFMERKTAYDKERSCTNAPQSNP